MVSPYYFFLQSLLCLAATRKFSVFITLPQSSAPALPMCYLGFRQASVHRDFFPEFVLGKYVYYLTPACTCMRYMIVINRCCRLTSARNMSHILVRRDSTVVGRLYGRIFCPDTEFICLSTSPGQNKQDAEFIIATADGTHSYHWVLNG